MKPDSFRMVDIKHCANCKHCGEEEIIDNETPDIRFDPYCEKHEFCLSKYIFQDNYPVCDDWELL
jgi:hypothetical protein